MAKRFATVLITGRFLESAPIEIEEIKKRIERELQKRSTAVARWQALLDRTHFSRAGLFLSSEFEILPVEAEDMELAFFAALSLAEVVRPDEIVCGFGESGSARLLHRLAGRVARTLLTVGPVATATNCENIIDCLSENGTASSTSPTTPSPEQNAPFDLSSKEWKDALTRYLTDNNGVCPAARAFDRLKTDYPLLADLYQMDKASVLAAIPETLRCIEEDGISILYRADHPNLRPVSATEAVTRLTFGGSPETKNETPESEPSDSIRQPAANFSEVADRAAIVAEQALWSRDRAKLVDSGANYQDVIQPRDRELEERAKANSIYLWMKRHEFEPEQWNALAETYKTLERGARLMQTALDTKSGKGMMEKIGKTFARSICLLKSMIRALGFDIVVDPVQRDAYELAIAFAKENGIFLPYLQRTDTCELSAGKEINEAIETLSAGLETQAVSVKTMQSVEKRVTYHINKIAQNPPGSENDWNKVVEGVTTLCDEFHMPTSAVLLRKLLSEYISIIPEEIELTPTFANVVQQIDLFEEQQAALFVQEDTKKIPKISPAVKKVRKIYGGSKVVWIGGTPVDHLSQRIENRFDIKLLWEESGHGDSFDRLTSVLNDPDVKLFLVYIPWCSHKHSEELTQLVKSAGKDFVRLRKGTNPDQIASTICQQTKG